VGLLIVNADDWGRDKTTTDRTFDCIEKGQVSAVSAMVFMQDSERAADLGRRRGIDAGLHLNFTTPFSATTCPTRVAERQRETAAYLSFSPSARAIFHPQLARAFEYLVAAQCDEFMRLYGAEPTRFDGHHHMHLAANVLLGRLLPQGSIVRRHFSYEPHEKPVRNWLFRRFTNWALKSRYRTTDFFFSLPPLQPPARLQKIFDLARQFVVELETHPINPDEFRFLTQRQISLAHDLPIGSYSTIPSSGLSKSFVRRTGLNS
jgi:predicted glycoside hydrolase/deacetylase ChbG (UPF0249 family)